MSEPENEPETPAFVPVPEVEVNESDPSKGTVELSDGSKQDVVYNEEMKVWETTAQASDEEIEEHLASLSKDEDGEG